MDNEVDKILQVDKEDLRDEQDKKITQMFRRVFGTEEGRIVLHQILIDLNYFDLCTNADEIARNNYAKFMIIKRLKVNNTKRMSDAILDSGLFKTN